MDRFAVNEGRMLYFHRVALDQARRSPGLLGRARRELERLRSQRPESEGVWKEWEGLLDGGLDAMAAAVLADTPQGGLLRANSPLTEGLAPEERNALWQRVGLQQFAAYYLIAVADLALTVDEQAAITGVAADTLAAWRETPPLTMTQNVLDELKLVVGLQHALEMLYPDTEVRRSWLRSHVDALSARPIDILTNGDGDMLQRTLVAAVQPLLKDNELPSH